MSQKLPREREECSSVYLIAPLWEMKRNKITLEGKRLQEFWIMHTKEEHTVFTVKFAFYQKHQQLWKVSGVFLCGRYLVE